MPHTVELTGSNPMPPTGIHPNSVSVGAASASSPVAAELWHGEHADLIGQHDEHDRVWEALQRKAPNAEILGHVRNERIPGGVLGDPRYGSVNRTEELMPESAALPLIPDRSFK